eukprot:g50435.t1
MEPFMTTANRHAYPIFHVIGEIFLRSSTGRDDASGFKIILNMPYINVKSAGGLSKEQKAKIAEEFTAVMERVAGKPKSYTYIVFEDVDRENWSIGGNLLG